VSTLQATAAALGSFVAEDFGHVCFLRSDGTVAVYRKAIEGRPELGALIGVGRWAGGIICGSGVNCGILVTLEQSLRAQTGVE